MTEAVIAADAAIIEAATAEDEADRRARPVDTTADRKAAGADTTEARRGAVIKAAGRLMPREKEAVTDANAKEG